METTITLTGQMPALWQGALAELRGDLGLIPGENGISVSCARGEALSVVSDGGSVRLTWAEPVQFYRALSLIPLPLTACEIRERPRFETVGPMIDASRNAVLTPEALRFVLRKMALMGLNLAMLYTEDTYEVPEQPFFGYKRGRYTYDELKALDDYGNMLGIELCPCVQALGHLKRALHWPALQHLRENDEVLLADLDETYVFLEQLLRAASAPYRSRRIHIGMDEAYGVGLGAHLRRFGYEDPHSVIGRHLSRVLEITDRLGLKAMMWSDMYFHLDGKDYHSEGMPSQKAIDAVDPRITLVYWDYYQNREELYADALAKHAKYPVPTVFAGGVWTWVGPAPSYHTAIANTTAGLAACAKAGVPLVLATAWGDNGGECPFPAALLGLQLYGELTYTGAYDQAALAARFRRCCGADAQAFLDLDGFNRLPGMETFPGSPVNVCKFMLYQDPLIQLFEQDMKGLPLAEHFAALAERYDRYAQENPNYRLLFRFYAALARFLTHKCRWHESAADLVRSGDRAGAARLADGVSAACEALEDLRSVWRDLWDAINKPYGFEIIDARLGGLRARLDTAGRKMRAFAEGAAGDIPELTSPTLPYKRRPDGRMDCTNTMMEIVSACTIDF